MDGSPEWWGNPFGIDDRLTLEINVCFDKEGIWYVKGCIQGLGFDNTITEQLFFAEFIARITPESASILETKEPR